MSTLSSLEDTIKEHFSTDNMGLTTAATGLSIANIDVGKILDIVSAIIAAAPAIENGIASAAPFVEAISEMIANGGKPTDDQWTALKAKLDANSNILAQAEASAQTELDPLEAPVNIGVASVTGEDDQ